MLPSIGEPYFRNSAGEPLELQIEVLALCADDAGFLETKRFVVAAVAAELHLPVGLINSDGADPSIEARAI